MKNLKKRAKELELKALNWGVTPREQKEFLRLQKKLNRKKP